MKKILLIPVLISVLFSFLALPFFIGLAQVGGNCGDGSCDTPEENPTNCPKDCEAPLVDTMTVLNNVTNWIFAILLAIAVIFIILAAFNFITAAGNPETVSKARNFVLYALIGVLVAFMSRGMVALINVIVK